MRVKYFRFLPQTNSALKITSAICVPNFVKTVKNVSSLPYISAEVGELDALLTVVYAVKIVTTFYKVQHEHITRGVVGCVGPKRVCFKFPGVC